MTNYAEFSQLLSNFGSAQRCDGDEIKKAYRRLARRSPYVNPGDKSAEDRFKDINEAYDILSDIDKRSIRSV